MKQFEFRLSLSADTCLDYYRGAARQVLARCLDGTTVQFPAALLQPFVTTGGVHGLFRLVCDEQHRNPELRRLA